MKRLGNKLYIGLSIFIGASFIVMIVLQSNLSNLNREYEKSKRLVKENTERNIELNMKINELASLEKIEEVAREYGLAYNNSNIKNMD